jgi:hypothetical protein
LHVGRDLRHGREALRQRPQVEAGAADHDRQPPLLQRGIDFRPGQRRPASGAAALGHRQEAVKAMRHRGAVGSRGLCRQDRQLAVDLHAVGVDHGAAELAGERQCQGRLPAGRRSAEHDDHGVV